MSPIDHHLVEALNQARTRPMNFVLLVKGLDEGTLIVSRQRIPPGVVEKMRHDLGDCHLFKGRCIGNAHHELTFETIKEPSGTLARTLRAIIIRDAGLTHKVEIHQVANLPDDEDHDEGDGKAAAETHLNEAAAQLDKEAIHQRLAALAGSYQQRTSGDGPDVQCLHTLFAAIKACVEKHDYPNASQGLDMMERLLTHAVPTQGLTTLGEVSP